MTHSDPDIDPGQAPEFPDEPAQTPDIDPGGAPAEMPDIQPGGGDEGDSRTSDQNAS
jgi:hypothetical protein